MGLLSGDPFDPGRRICTRFLRKDEIVYQRAVAKDIFRFFEAGRNSFNYSGFPELLQ